MAPAASSSSLRMAIQQLALTQRLTIEPYSWYKCMGAGKPIKSGKFTLGGHPWTLVFYPGGYYPNSPYVTVFLRLENNLVMEQLRLVADFTLVDGGADAHSRRMHHTFRKEGEISCGFAEFARQHDVEASGCLRGDRLVLECAVRLVEDGEELRAPAPPPSDLQRDLRRMLEGGAGADVTIVAGGRPFRAHRCVLAARSPLLRAQLCGPMRDGREVIELPDDVAPEVFAAVLRFIYGDALPAPGHGEEADDAPAAQRLLAAADLYALDGLSRACQDMLCRCVTPCTAADTYALADRLNMPRVKVAVVESLAVCADGMEAVKASAGFQELATEDAALAEEINPLKDGLNFAMSTKKFSPRRDI
ncbi:hypothetical protein C2845_PM13G10060 [Panicum miliaceum]|uniref:BTB/POZ and MATH domain-containing protein 1-like n=1 Tax=Panicum miliaceum TaxID=4540 RepID=A0A3L6RJU3_PANMI|nr:hypothetical protein C2845_PM13G10060 [Panicum miliaceum]